MKKLSTIALVLLVIMTLASCGKEHTFTVTHAGMSMSDHIDYSNIIYTDWNGITYDGDTPAETLTVTINGTEYTGKLSKTEGEPFTNEWKHYYKPIGEDQSFNQFAVNEDGELVSYISNGHDEIAPEDEIDEEKALEIATDFLSQFTNTNLYQVDPIRSSMQSYRIHFYPVVNGIKLYSHAEIVVYKNGKIGNYYSMILNDIETSAIRSYQKDDIIQATEQHLNALYADLPESFEVSYDFEDVFATILPDGDLGFVCTSNVTLLEYDDQGGYSDQTNSEICVLKPE